MGGSVEGTDVNWRKSSFSGSTGGECVEVGEGLGAVLVRDTKQAQMGSGCTVLRLTRENFRRLTSDIKRNTL